MTAASADWFAEADIDGDGFNDAANDANTLGRGSVALKWAAVPSASSYDIYLFDGSTYRKVGVTTGTSWTSAGKGLYPSDTAISNLAAGTTGNPFLAGTGLDLRDDPRGLYAKTAGSSWDNVPAYAFKVVARNSVGSSVISDAPTASVTLDSRTLHLNDDPAHTTFDLGGIEDDGSSVLLDAKTLRLSSTDLDIESFGPDTALSRTYNSNSTTTGLFGAPGWMFGFEQSISADARHAVYTDEVGDRHVFTRSDAGSWVSPMGLDAVLTGGSGSGYTLAYHDRTVDEFDSNGTFVSEADNNGLKTTVARGTDGNGHSTVTLSASNGHQIVLTTASATHAKATYSADGQTREVDYTWAGSGSGSSATGTETVSTVYSDDGATPTNTTRYVYSAGRLVSVLVSASTPIAHVNGSADWDFSYTGDALASIVTPAYDGAGDRAVTHIVYGEDANGLAKATITQRGEVGGQVRDVTRTYGINPSKSMAYKTNPYVAGDPVKTWAYTYSAQGDQASETDPDSEVSRSVFDTSSDEIVSVDTMGRTTSNTYDSHGDLLSSTDPAGSVVSNDYDANGNLVLSTKTLDASGKTACMKCSYDTDATWRKTSDVQELSVSGSTSHWLDVEYSYDENNGADRPSIVTQCGLAGDASGQNLVAEDIDLGGGASVPSVRTSAHFDGWGNQTSSTDASGALTTARFDLAGNQTKSTDSLGLATNHTYDGLGHALSTWQSRDNTSAVIDYTQSDFDAFGHMVEERDYLTSGGISTAVLNATTRHFFDAMGKEIGLHNSAVCGLDARDDHDAMGNCTKSWTSGLEAGQHTDAYAVRSVYDAEGREISSTMPAAAVADTKTYNADSSVAMENKPDGTAATYTYDAAGNLASESVNSTAGVTTTRSVYDKGGRMVTSVDGDGSETDYDYDLASRRVAAHGPGQPAASTTTYNALGWTTRAIDADGIVTTDTYDVCGRVVGETVGTGQGPTRSSFDATGRLLRQIDPNGRQLDDVYDGFGRVVRETQVSTATASIPLMMRTVKDVSTTYDSASREATTADSKSGVVTTYRYPDPGTAGRTIQTISCGGLSTTVNVDSAGNEATRVTSGAGVSFTRSVDATDQAGRITGWHVGGFAQTRAFDSDGHVASQAGSGFSGPATYVYNGMIGKKSEDHIRLSSQAGGPIDWTYGYNKDGRLVSAAPTGQTAEMFGYSEGGNVTSYRALVDRAGSTEPGVFGYDATGRLAKRFASNGTTLLESYVYDPAQGARRSQTRSGEAAVTYTYTGQQGLATYSKPAGAQGGAAAIGADYTYDATGQRLHSSVSKTLAGVTSSTETTWTYSGTTLLSFDTTQSGGTASAWKITYLYDDESRPYAGVYRSNGASPVVFGIVTTDRGDVVALTDAHGDPFASYRYDPWGRPLGAPITQGTGSVSSALAAEIAWRQVLRYVGYVYDAETGFYYCSARTYDPNTMQFLQKDPAKADGEDSAYQYCEDDPISGTDPTGMDNPSQGAYGPSWSAPKKTKKSSKTKKKSAKKKSSSRSSHSNSSSKSDRKHGHVFLSVRLGHEYNSIRTKIVHYARLVVSWKVTYSHSALYRRHGHMDCSEAADYVFSHAGLGFVKGWTTVGYYHEPKVVSSHFGTWGFAVGRPWQIGDVLVTPNEGKWAGKSNHVVIVVEDGKSPDIFEVTGSKPGLPHGGGRIVPMTARLKGRYGGKYYGSGWKPVRAARLFDLS